MRICLDVYHVVRGLGSLWSWWRCGCYLYVIRDYDSGFAYDDYHV